MKGKYIIYSDGVPVAEFDNIITDRGRKVIGDFLSGSRSSWSDTIAIGSGDSTPQQSDQFLDMEFRRDEVDLRSYDSVNNKIKLRSRVPASAVGKIYELAVFATSSSNKIFSVSPIISTFDASVENWQGGSTNTTDHRIGNSARDLALSASTESAYLDFEGDLRAYNNETKFRLAYSSTGTFSSVVVRLRSSASDYREYTFTPPSSGYQVESWQLQDFSITGSSEWNEIYRLEIIASGTGTIAFDGLSATDEVNDDPSNILVSRALVNFNSQSFFQKNPRRELQIEYILDISI